MVEPPSLADILKPQVSAIREREVLLPTRFLRFIVVPLRLADVIRHRTLDVRVVETARDAIGKEHVRAAIEVEVR